ncbi:puromycin-sensitive aminopeptidase [Nematocida sp. AWRm80]|nr:puromycin-sensitive aminopeptidase [Nematocida sp. AWRm80]
MSSEINMDKLGNIIGITEEIDVGKMEIGNRLSKDILPREYTLDLAVGDDIFHGKATIECDVSKSTRYLMLNSSKLEISSVRVYEDNKEVELNEEIVNKMEVLVIVCKKVLEKGSKVRVVIEYSAEIKDTMAGFYKSIYRSNGKESSIYSTQFEATSARLAFPCWDEPEFKAVFNIRIITESKYVVLSNSKELYSKEITNTTEHEYSKALKPGVQYKEVAFKPTLVMSTYLLAWVIGDLKYLERENIKVYAPNGLEDQGEFALDVACKCLKFFSSYFGIKYQMEKLDMVAIPDFSAGAMENWGLVTYRSSALLFKKGSTTERAKLQIAETVCHELAHQWFGNLVTMRWWNDLWLNEGFASWAGVLAVTVLSKKGPEEGIVLGYDPKEVFITDDISEGMSMDSRLSTHPINIPVTTVGEISSIFDAISYSKGASIIHMLACYLGETVFQEGLIRYISKYKYKNATTQDLWDQIDPTAERGVTTAMNNWINISGLPIVHVDVNGNKITLRQEKYLPEHNKDKITKDIWSIFLTHKVFKEQPEIHSIMFDQKTMELEMEADNWIFNHESSGFYWVKYSPEALKSHVIPLLQSPTALSKYDRYAIFRDIFRFAVDGHDTARSALEIIKYIQKDESSLVLLQAIAYLKSIAKKFEQIPEIKSAAETQIVTLLEPYATKLKSYNEVSSQVEERLLQVLAVGTLAGIKDTTVQKKAIELLNSKEGFSQTHPEYKMSLYISIAKYGDKKGYDYLYKIITDPTDESEKLRAILAIAYTNVMINEAFDLFAKKNQYIKDQDKIRMIYGLADYKDKQLVLTKFFKEFPSLCKIYEVSPDHIARFVKELIAVQTEDSTIKIVRDFFADPKNLQDAWKPAVARGFDIVEVSVRFYTANLQSLKEWAKDNE